jgi:regulator of protease activity HflC (stomatin/prohibitin superfamily)
MFLSLPFLSVYVVVLLLIISSVTILREYERAVVFHLGRFQASRAQGSSSSCRSFNRSCAWICARW